MTDFPFDDDIYDWAFQPWWHALIAEVLSDADRKQSFFAGWSRARECFLDMAPDGVRIREIEAQIGEWPVFELDKITNHVMGILTPPVIAEAYMGLCQMMVCVAVVTSVESVEEFSDHELCGLSAAWLDAATCVLAFVRMTDEEMAEALKASQWLRDRFCDAQTRAAKSGRAEPLFPEFLPPEVRRDD